MIARVNRLLFFSALIVGGLLLCMTGCLRRHSLSNSLDEEIRMSHMLHSPLPLDGSRSVEASQLKQPVLLSEAIPLDNNAGRWRHEGFGRMEYIADSGLCLTVPVHTGERAKGPAGDPDYATFGRASLSLDMDGRDLRPFTRMVMEVKPVCHGVMIMNLNAVLQNAQPNTLGAHLINLTNNRWNTVVFDISGLERDSVMSLTLYTDLKGRNEALCDSITYMLRNLRLEQVQEKPKEIGWDVQPGCIAYSSTGYLVKGRKTAVADSSPEGTFSLVDEESEKVCFTGKTQPIQTALGSFSVLDFSRFMESGHYRLRLGETLTEPFLISDDAFLDTQWRLLNFIFCQRCGYKVPGIHGVCHQDVFCNHAGQEVCYGGGWHDAGDLSQQTLQTADVAHSLLEAFLHNKDAHPLLAKRLLEEAEWGLRFVLRCRFGDGFRASSLGLLHWTDSQTGTYDDIHSVRKQDNAFDNYLYAAYEASAAKALPASPLRDSLAKAAAEDFRFAEKKFMRDGYDHFPHIMEHTYNTSPSLFQAARSWSATQLYLMTGESAYAQTAICSIRYVLRCQEREGFSGYFYRDTTRRAPVHFIHQSRDQLFPQALIALCQSQPSHPDAPQWDDAIRRYADYLKRLMPYTEPYGMIPSGIWQAEEYADPDGFHSLHIFAPGNAQQLFDSQLRCGEKIDERHYLRRFPMSFGIFNGNEAIILSTGKGAALCGHYLNDEALRQIGLEQLYWTVGKNPFCQSLIYGEGHRYPSMDSFSSGEITGEIPVGIRSYGNDDVPYWPQTNNACYKEVWVTSAGKLLSLIAEYE